MREEDFLRGQFSLQEAMHASWLGLAGYDKIISGCEASVGAGGITVTAGFIFLDGEVMEVEAQTVADTLGSGYWRYEKATTYDSGGDRTFVDGLFRQTWRNVRGVPVNVASLSAGDLDVENGARQILHKVFNIGTWNMDSTDQKVVSFPAEITSWDKVVSINAMILNDNNPGYDTFVSGGVITLGTGGITLTRDVGGKFDNATYDNSSINRGIIFAQFEC